MRSALATGLASWVLAWQSEVERRANFLMQMAFMIVNDLIFVTFWFLVYSHRDSIRGWDQHDVLVLFATFSLAGGLGLGFANGVRRLGLRIDRGDLDAYLVQPQPVVLRVITARIQPSVLGDALFGPALLACTGETSWHAWARYLVTSCIGASIVVAFMLVWESLAFWGRGAGEFAGVAFTSLAVMSTYPVSVFPTLLKTVMFTAIPAALVASVPAELVLEPTWGLLGALLLGFAGVWIAGLFVFHAGLRKYMRAS